MVINIFAGGPEQFLPPWNEVADLNAMWVGVDRGVHTLLTKGVVPDAAFGDFDSVSDEELKAIQQRLEELHIYPSEKDETDLELAFQWAVSQRPDVINIYAATGGRLDHLLGNIQLITKDEFLMNNDIEVYIIDDKNKLTVKTPGSYDIAKASGKKYISFIPITDEVFGITLKGFKYPLENSHIKRGSTLCISNELISEYGNFSFSDGILLVVSSSD
jgi:thiamine pyrophosphokinase